MFKRELSEQLKNCFRVYPTISITGPRQSGKTTLAKETFPNLNYINLEDPSICTMVRNDPKSFLDQYINGMIIDEVQNIPELFSYLQVYIDERDRPGQYVLTGSQQFLLNERISQSLAGRISIFNLLPLSYRELHSGLDLYELMFRGFYPRIHRYNISPQDFYPSYIQTYVERDLRMLSNITDLGLFQKFIYLCAGRVGQILNLSSLANDCGISNVTATKWVSLLESSYIVYLLKPYYTNINKRLIKAPKLYFYDTGLLSSLLNIQDSQQLKTHYATGGIFENYIIMEMKKFYSNRNIKGQLYYLRNKTGQEIDILIDKGATQTLIELKSSKTFNDAYLKNIEYWTSYFENSTNALIYAGDRSGFRYKNTNILNWKDFYQIL